MSTIWIDGQSFEVSSDKNLLETILSLGFDLPYFCWHPALGSVGSCRQCAIKKYKGADDRSGQLVMACMEPTTDGQRLSVRDRQASEFRERVIEWLMLNHPHDCPICDEGGECHLQDMTVMAGHAYRRTRFKKRTYNNQYLGPCINHEMNRCIQCYRCVRFYNDYAGGDDLQVFSAHDHVYFGRHEDGTLESEFSGNLVEVCPTGVFTDKTLKKHYTRKWDLTSAPSVCHHCSLGCNILAGERYGSLRRILSRYNPEVNGYFICDRGRFGYDFVNGKGRIGQSFSSGAPDEGHDIPAATQLLKSKLTAGKILGIGSPRASLESNYVLRELVGADNYYNGIEEQENRILQMALQFLTTGPVRTPSLKEVEHFDAVVVIGEDLTNTAPMLDLALNQSVRVQPLRKISKIGLPEWNDAAVREYIQQEKGPLYILTPQKTKLDRIATKCYRDHPVALTHLVNSLAHELDSKVPLKGIASSTDGIVKEIAAALSASERPLVITGSSLGSIELVQAAINLANALYQVNPGTGISFVFPEGNSVGVGMMESRSLNDAITSKGGYESVIVLENDLFRRASTSQVNQFMDSFRNIVVLDHTKSGTTAKAGLVLASGTFAEADGTVVNQEGRAQRFFQVQANDVGIQESWRWLIEAGRLLDNEKFTGLGGLDDIIARIEDQLPQFSGITKAGLQANHRINGQKIGRAPHRYSGRTAMFANHAVNEPRPPRDPDSPLSFTMEGYQGIPPASATPFYWSPGWNSAQAINKFRNEVSHGRQKEDPGMRLFEPSADHQFPYFEDFSTEEDNSREWKIIPLHHIFGSEEMSIKSEAILDRSPGPRIIMNQKQATELDISQGENVSIFKDDLQVTFIAQPVSDWPRGYLGIYVGFPNVPFINSSSVVELTKKKNEG